MTFAAMTAKRIGRCRICGEAYAKRSSTQTVCGVRCSQEAARLKREKDAAKQAKAERKVDRERKDKLKTRSDYIKGAQVAFNNYVRTRDQDRPCICCGRPLFTERATTTGGSFDCGHYRSVGSAPHLRFDLRNAHGQRKVCNQYGSGRAVDYRIGLIARRGVALVEALEADNEPRKHDIAWLKRFTAIMRAKLRRMKRRGK